MVVKFTPGNMSGCRFGSYLMKTFKWRNCQMKKIRLLTLLGVLFLSLTAMAQKLEELKEQLNSTNPVVRLAAVRELSVQYTLNGGLPFLLRAAMDEDEEVRERAIQGLGLSGNSQAIPAVKKALKDRDEFVRWRAVQALDRLGDRSSVNDLANLLLDESWRVKVSVLELLGKINGKLLEAKPAGSPGSLSGTQIKQLIARCLDDPDERIRLAAASALARNKDEAALGPLLDLLRNASMFTRGEAGAALGELGDPTAVKPLIDAVEDPRNTEEQDGRDWARWGAVRGLVKLTGQNLGADARKWQQWLETNKTR